MHQKIVKRVSSAIIGCALILSAQAFAGGEAGKLTLRDLGEKFVGYTVEPQSDGTVNVINPLFVQYMLPAKKKHDLPIVMIHGGGGQGTDWMQTPDDRDGFSDYFVAAGWDTYVVDRPGHGRAQSNPSCGNGTVGTANSGLISRLAHADPSVWPGGEPTPTNEYVVAWTASSETAPYCGDVVAAKTISALLDEIGPAILLTHSAGGGSTFRVPDLNPKNVVGIIAFEAAGANPLQGGFGGGPAITSWKTEPPLPAGFRPVTRDGCAMQGDNPSQLVNYKDLPIVLVASEMGLSSKDAIMCQASVWNQAGADASWIYLPDLGLTKGGHFAVAQLDNAKYAKAFIDMADDMEAKVER